MLWILLYIAIGILIFFAGVILTFFVIAYLIAGDEDWLQDEFERHHGLRDNE